ncbi:hypothetical protein PC119_g28614 [Phytophthora cactorum]|nr:hypothetical protein PC119_g28614 [Phytophthora cactorum]
MHGRPSVARRQHKDHREASTVHQVHSRIHLSIQKQVHREREVLKAKVIDNAKQTSKLHRLLSDLIKGDSSDVQAMQSKVAVQRDQIHRLTRTNGILRQQVDLRRSR